MSSVRTYERIGLVQVPLMGVFLVLRLRDYLRSYKILLPGPLLSWRLS